MTTVQELLIELVRLEKRGPEVVSQVCRVMRQLGFYNVGSADFPDQSEHSKHYREHTVWNCRLFKDIPDDEFEDWLRIGAQHPATFSVDTLVKKARRYRANAQHIARQARTQSVDGLELYVADIHDITELRLGKAAAVITDPPYEQNGLPLWAELLRFSDDVLVEHGWLLAMTGKQYLPQVLARCELGIKNKPGSTMRYCFTLAVLLPGGESAKVWIGPSNLVNAYWKPVLVYSKGVPSTWPHGFSDIITSEVNDKRFHEWGQSVNVFQALVDHFAQPGSLVVDPFLGGGTTAVGARPSRSFEGFDIDRLHVTTSVERLEKLWPGQDN